MYLVYLGESGNTGNSTNDPNHPHQVHVGLIVHESHTIAINGEVNALHRRHFGRPPGEPDSPKGLRTADIYQGVGAYSSWPVSKRHELIQDCLNILIRRHLPVIVAYLDKNDFATASANKDDPSAVWESPAEPIISRFLLALNMYLDEMSVAGMNPEQVMSSAAPIKDFALVVAGDNRSVEPKFMNQFLKSEEGFDVSSLLENFCFVGPEHSVCTQLANMCAYFTRRWLQNPSDPHPYFDALRDQEVVQVIYPVQL